MIMPELARLFRASFGIPYEVMRTDTFEIVRREDPFTRLDNEIFHDKSISLKARGLLCTCLSLSPTWSFSIRGLVSICKDGRAAVESALDELEAAGYLERSRIQEHKENGTFGGTRYRFYESPCAENPHAAEKSPCAENSHAGKPHAGNLPQVNNKQETKKQEIPLKPPRGRAAKAAPDYEPEIFSRFWTAYPIGRDKQGAIREWDKLKPSRQLMQTMAAALAEQKKTLSAEDPHDRYPFPYAIRWIRDRRWEDDLQKSTQRAAKSEPHAGRSVDAPEVAQW